jgi:hypothetical protein
MKSPEVIAERRRHNRRRMPTVAAMVDEYRASFPGLQVIFASEEGFSVGKPPKKERAFTIPRNYRKPAGGWPK